MKRIRLLAFCFTVLGSLAPLTGWSQETANSADQTQEFFEKQVRPILVARCYECHAGNEHDPKGGLRLDTREFLLKGGDTGPAVELNKPQESLFLSAINYGDLYQMPPKSKLPAAEIEILTRWVTAGLYWPKDDAANVGAVRKFDLAARARDHWCWQPLTDSTPPDVKQSEWPATDVDRYILAGLEAHGLQPGPPADKRTLLRRVYFDLIGLPPTPAELDAYLNDADPRALEHVVDRLLSSVHFAERWARHWMDLTRYAETRGHEFEPIIPNAWQYRDYVVRALHADVPYDRFLTEHLAGDLLDPRWRDMSGTSTPTTKINESILGTGFWFLGEEVHSPVDIRKDETDRIDNRIDVMSKTFLGLTVACARCHDHKFDAISQRDYYALAGYALSGSYRQIRVESAEQDRELAQALEDHRRRARRQVAETLVAQAQPIVDRLDQYWTVACQVLDANTTPGQPAITDLDPATIKQLEQPAIANGLDFPLLQLWCKELIAARQSQNHPLAQLTSAAAVTSPPQTAVDQGLIVDFGNLSSNGVRQNGVTFGVKPVEPGTLRLEGTPVSPQLGITTVGGWERDLFWKGQRYSPGTELDHSTMGAWQFHGRMVRSPEFVLDAKNVWILVRGSVRVYATVNSHLIVAGPLHGGLLREFRHNDNDWHWVGYGLEAYRGHRLHLEFTPIDDQPCSVAMIRQSDEQPAVLDASWKWLSETLPAETPPLERFGRFRHEFKNALQLLVRRNIGGAAPIESPVNPERASQERQLARLLDWMLSHRTLFGVGAIEVPLETLQQAEAALASQVRWDSSLAPVMQEGNGVNELLLVRGNSNTPREPVQRRFLQAFEPAVGAESASVPPVVAEGSGRLELAARMLHSPLASRVAVNRVWHHLFGRGIVPSVDNMGVLGLPPSHPELLDHLAKRFVQDGWSMKRLIRSLVLSKTYQMSSHPTADDARDPANEYWHRMPIKRLEGEVIRDTLLAISGRLDPTPFGRSIPIHLTEFMQGRGRPDVNGPLDGAGRRSLYIAVRRNFLSPMMLAFDTPSPFSTVGRRTVSNVPAQALILMNDPFVVEQAQRWADRLLAQPNRSPDDRISDLYLTAYARPATDTEKTAAKEFLTAQETTSPAAEREAWMNLCHVLINVKEFVYIE